MHVNHPERVVSSLLEPAVVPRTLQKCWCCELVWSTTPSATPGVATVKPFNLSRNSLVPWLLILNGTRQGKPLQGLKLAQPVTAEGNFAISLLIGTDYYWKFVQDHIVRGDSPTAQQSKLGYLLSGPVPSTLSETTAYALLQITSMMTAYKLKSPDLLDFWSVESIGTDGHSKPMDSTFLQAYQQSSIAQTPDGAYVARFPWKVNRPYLPSNIAICKKRMQTLMSKLKKAPDILQLYDNIIREQEARGFIERVHDEPTHDVHYLPHHPVKKDSATTPIRVVYDCSCRRNSYSASLNNCLMVGPPFLNNLCAILLHFCVHAFALSTDIEKTFLYVKLHPSDRNFTRFLWPANVDTPDEIMCKYRFAVVPFGSTSSPFMLGAVLDLHLSKFDTPVALDMRDNVYIDNILSGCQTEDELLKYYTQSRNIRACTLNKTVSTYQHHHHQMRGSTGVITDIRPTWMGNTSNHQGQNPTAGNLAGEVCLGRTTSKHDEGQVDCHSCRPGRATTVDDTESLLPIE